MGSFLATIPPVSESTGGSPSAECSEPLGFLEELLQESLARHEALKRQVAIGAMDLLENVIRTAWYCDDARAYMAGERKYASWIQSRYKVSIGVAGSCKQSNGC
jgi:hypothetical protein